MQQNKLTSRQRILVAGTLFGMFFGAGNLIFPVHLGQLAGKNLIPAILGFIITAVSIPILGVAAIGNTHSDGLQSLSGKVGKGYSYVFTCMLYLTIGPFFAIPRCSTTSFTVGIESILPEGTTIWPILLLFSFVFFAIVLVFSLKPQKITVWIGKIINPVFLVLLTIIVIMALMKPGADALTVAPDPAYESGSFFNAIIEGYGTMDAIAALAFGIVVIDVIREMGVENDTAIAKDVLRSGILTGILMAVIYTLTIIMGAQSRGIFEISENGGIALAQISKHYLGTVGSIILAITITFACLKTSIGLVTSCSKTFVKMFPKLKLGYSHWVIIFTVFSFVVSNIGLSTIIGYSVPMLMLIYPPAITLIILALCGNLFGHDRKVYISVTACTWFASIFDCLKTLPDSLKSALNIDSVVKFAGRILPFFDMSLGWVVPALIGLVVGLVLHFTIKTDKKENA